MNGPRDYHTKWSQTKKDKHQLYVESKNDTNELICKTETLMELENKFMVTKAEREVEERIN